MFQDDEDKEKEPLEIEPTEAISNIGDIYSKETSATEILIDKKEEEPTKKDFRLIDYDEIYVWLKIKDGRSVVAFTEPEELKDSLEAKLFQFGSDTVRIFYKDRKKPYVYIKVDDKADLNYRTGGEPLRLMVYMLEKEIETTTKKATNSNSQ